MFQVEIQKFYGYGAVSVGESTGALTGELCWGVRPPITDVPPPWRRIAIRIAPTINNTARTVVARDSRVAPLRAPKAV